jgi:hypothetical protein
LSGDLGGGGGVEGLNSRGASFRGRSGAAPWIVLVPFAGREGDTSRGDSGVKRRREI